MMGIKNLIRIIRAAAPTAIVSRRLEYLRGKTVCIDASNYLYSLVYVGVSRGIKNQNNQYINHLQGILFRISVLLSYEITPVFIFDGIPPEAKNATIEARQANQSRIKMPREVISDAKKLLDLLGVRWIVAPSEAEATASAMVKAGLAYAVITEDVDTIAHGARMIKDVKIKSSGKSTVIMVYPDVVLDKLKISYESFVDLCILLGSDYTATIPNIGAVRAFKLIKEYGSIPKILEALNIILKTNDFDYETARREFMDPVVADIAALPPIIYPTITKLDAEKIRKFLVDKHGLNPKKVDSSIDRILDV